jgi:acyl carrier protein phosphodiesterase
MVRDAIEISSKSFIDSKSVDKRNRKTDLDKIIITLLDELGAIEASDKTQSAKTTAYTRAAKKVITALYGKRKQKGSNSLSLDGAAKALTKVRNAVSATGAMHHSFDKSLASLRKNYPLCAYMVDEIDGLPLKETRETWSAIRERISHVIRVEKQLLKISPEVRNYATVINHMAKEFPAWSKEITALKTLRKEDRQPAIDKLLAIFEETREFYPSLNNLKIDHEVMRHLTKDAFSTDNKQAESQANLTRKKEGAVQIDYSKMMQVLSMLLADSSALHWEALAIGVGMATGRRPIEVLFQGEFEKIDKHRLSFTGQAKKRGGVTGESMDIYSLADSDLVLKAISKLRAFSNIASLQTLTPERHYSVNELISNRTAGPINKFMRDLLKRTPITVDGNEKSWVFKDTRAMYAKTCFELFFKDDKRWLKKDENMFYQELLGHHDTDAQNHYMQFKIYNAGASWEPIVDDSPERRINAMKAMRENEWITARESRSSLHEVVISMIENDPWRTIKPVDIRKDTAGKTRNYTMVKQYLDVVQDAIKVDQSLDAILEKKAVNKSNENDKSEVKSATKPSEPATKQLKPEASEKAAASKPKVHFKGAHQSEDDSWSVSMIINDTEYEVLVDEAENMRDAGTQAWNTWNLSQSLPKKVTPALKKEGDMWKAWLNVNGQVLFEVWTPSKKSSSDSCKLLVKQAIQKVRIGPQ